MGIGNMRIRFSALVQNVVRIIQVGITRLWQTLVRRMYRRAQQSVVRMVAIQSRQSCVRLGIYLARMGQLNQSKKEGSSNSKASSPRTRVLLEKYLRTLLEEAWSSTVHRVPASFVPPLKLKCRHKSESIPHM